MDLQTVTLLLRIVSFIGTKENATGIQLGPGEVSDTQRFVIRSCKFLGPMQTGVAFSGNVTNTQISSCIFHQAQDGIVFQGPDQILSNVQISNNTFHDLQRGLFFDGGPHPTSQAVAFTQNLFSQIGNVDVQSTTEVNLETIGRGAPLTRYNWSTQQGTASKLDLFQREGRRNAPVEFVSTDPQQPGFLKPKSPELRSIVKQPNGPLKYIGAVAP